MTTFVERYGLVLFKTGISKNFIQPDSCDLDGCDEWRAQMRAVRERKLAFWKDSKLPDQGIIRRLEWELYGKGPKPSARRIMNLHDQPRLVLDHCHTHAWCRGFICSPCNSAMKDIDLAYVLPNTRREMRYSYVRHYNQCPDCTPVPFFLTREETRYLRFPDTPPDPLTPSDVRANPQELGALAQSHGVTMTEMRELAETLIFTRTGVLGRKIASFTSEDWYKRLNLAVIDGTVNKQPA